MTNRRGFFGTCAAALAARYSKHHQPVTMVGRTYVGHLVNRGVMTLNKARKYFGRIKEA